MTASPTDIDVVIAWVDGNDPVHRAKRARYAGRPEIARDDVGGDTRFVSTGEIYYCVASIVRFAPFVRRIFIVTDGQDPHADAFVARHFPDCRIPIEVVDHTVLFAGYETCLPTFNSLSIETMLWRIPGLSEHFVYFNDDVFVAAPLHPEDWFDPRGRAVCYGTPFSSLLARLLRTVKPRRNGQCPFGHKDAMLNAADLLGRPFFFHFHHTPLAQRRSVLADYFTTHPEALVANMRPRFREPHQFNPQELCYLLGVRADKCVLRSPKGRTLFLKPAADRTGYMERKLIQADRMDHLLFGCINSLEQAPEADRQRFVDWMARRIGIDFSMN